jgi:hypothetical protein
MITRAAAGVFGVLAGVALLAGCEIFGLDNYDEPASSLTGRVVYQGQPIGVRSGGVQLELWQPAYPLAVKIPVHIAQDGSFTASLFDGDYEINLLPGNGPWVDDATRIPLPVRKNGSVDIAVTPYYLVGNEQVRNDDGAIVATFRVQSIHTTRLVEYVGLYVSTTGIVDRNNQVLRLERPRAQIPSFDAIEMRLTLPESIRVKPEPGPRTEVFVRLGVKTVGVAELVYSPVYRIAI